MATTRKPGASKKAPVQKSPAKKAAPRPAAKAVKPAKPAPKAPVKAAAKPAPKAHAKPAAKAPPAKSVRPAAPVKPAGKAVPPAKAVAGGKHAPPAKGGPVKPSAKGAAAAPKSATAAAKPGKPSIAAPVRPIGKIKLVPAPAPSVRPIGVLPPEAMAKTTTKSPRPVGPSRPAMPARPTGAPTRPTTKDSMKDQRLSEADLKHFEQRLLQERARIMKEMGHLESTVLKVNPRDSAGELSGYSFHMADAGTDSMEREKAFDIASKEGRLLMEIDAALGRLYRGEYGVCEASGKPISRARLEALPWARYTVEEQEKLEREQRAGRAPQPE